MNRRINTGQTKISQSSRDETIDILRGGSILLMIAMHIAPSFRAYPISDFLWSWGQWVVPVFLLCSFAVGKHELEGFSGYIHYVMRRLKRLLIPYYIFLAVYLLIDMLLYRKDITLPVIVKNITLTGGVDFNWMILLFVSVTLFLPIASRLVREQEGMTILLIMLTILISWFAMIDRGQWGPTYRSTMIPMWHGITLALLLFLKWVKEKRTISIVILFISLFVLFVHASLFLKSGNVTTHLYFHKYPPDALFVSYSIWSTIAVYVVVTLFERFGLILKPIHHILSWVSIHSYTIFFVHIIVLHILKALYPTRQAHYLLFAVLVYAVTFLVVAVKQKVEILVSPKA